MTHRSAVQVAEVKPGDETVAKNRAPGAVRHTGWARKVSTR